MIRRSQHIALMQQATYKWIMAQVFTNASNRPPTRVGYLILSSAACDNYWDTQKWNTNAKNQFRISNHALFPTDRYALFSANTAGVLGIYAGSVYTR